MLYFLSQSKYVACLFFGIGNRSRHTYIKHKNCALYIGQEDTTQQSRAVYPGRHQPSCILDCSSACSGIPWVFYSVILQGFSISWQVVTSLASFPVYFILQMAATKCRPKTPSSAGKQESTWVAEPRRPSILRKDKQPNAWCDCISGYGIL